MLKFVFWQSYLMCHQAGYIRALAERPDCRVTWAVEQPLQSQYRRRGYPIPELGQVTAVIAPDEEIIHRLLADDPWRTVHVFMGLRRNRLSGRAFELSKAYPVRRLLLSENRFEWNWRLPLRWAMYRWHALRSRRYLDRLLCMGYGGRWGGRTWFRLCGYPDRLISPFAYTSEESVAPDAVRASIAAPVSADMIFVGQLIRRKGLDLLLEAMAGTHALAACRLTVVGTGPLQDSLERMADRLGIGGRVSFLGEVEHARIGALIAAHRMLVLPSRYDGWGAVVNEALLAGTPAVCSDRAGASDLVAASGMGAVFRSGDVADLGRALRACLALSESPSRRAEWLQLRDSIRGPSVAQYLVDMVSALERDAPLPPAPWLAPEICTSARRGQPPQSGDVAPARAAR